MGIYEMFVMDDRIRAAVRSAGRIDEIRTLARENGMKRMQEYALEHVREGLTTLDEVQRVVPFEQIRATYCRACQQELSPGFRFCPYCGEKVGGAPKARKSRRRTLVEQGAVKQ